MSTQSDVLGTCPECGERLPAATLLIEYETDDGTAVFADCPACREVVHPE